MELTDVIKSQILNTECPVPQERLSDLVALASDLELQQFVYSAMGDKRKLHIEMARIMHLEYAKAWIMNAFEESGIPHVLLKGAVLRGLYPEAWMRTSCDIDILVHEEDQSRAAEVLQKKGYRIEGKKQYHDISLYSPEGVHLELHHSIKENIDPMDSVLETVWNHVVQCEGYQYRYMETPEFFWFHHIAHMAYHFYRGGCGIRPFVDLWLMRNKLQFSQEPFEEMINNAGLAEFYKYVNAITDYWFENGRADEMVYQMERYITNGGVYGTTKQAMIIKQGKNGKLLFFIRRFFLPYKNMVIIYPSLTKHKWMLPFYYILRFGKWVKKWEKAKNEIHFAMNLEQDYSVDMMQNLGLQKR